jgi:AbrB family looped-hinge helix DNA binding protein
MPKIVGASKVTARYQVTIPSEVRSILNVSIGDTLVFVKEKDRVLIATEI